MDGDRRDSGAQGREVLKAEMIGASCLWHGGFILQRACCLVIHSELASEAVSLHNSVHNTPSSLLHPLFLLAKRPPNLG